MLKAFNVSEEQDLRSSLCSIFELLFSVQLKEANNWIEIVEFKYICNYNTPLYNKLYAQVFTIPINLNGVNWYAAITTITDTEYPSLKDIEECNATLKSFLIKPHYYINDFVTVYKEEWIFDKSTPPKFIGSSL